MVENTLAPQAARTQTATTAVFPESALPLTETWIQWLQDNIERGCRDLDLQASMVKQGYQAEFAAAAIGVVRAMPFKLAKRDQRADTRQDSRSPSSNFPGWFHCNQPATRSYEDHVYRCLIELKDPRIAYFEGFLTAEECDTVIELARPTINNPSTVVNNETGGSYQDNARTSLGTHFAGVEHPVLRRIERRIENLTTIPVSHGESIQVLMYPPGAEYRGHHDYFVGKAATSETFLGQAGQRVATVVMYLNDVEEGGGTGFPTLGLTAQARKGCAVLFEYGDPSGRLDPRLLHAGLPVVTGEKWIATKWLRLNSFY